MKFSRRNAEKYLSGSSWGPLCDSDTNGSLDMCNDFVCRTCVERGMKAYAGSVFTH